MAGLDNIEHLKSLIEQRREELSDGTLSGGIELPLDESLYQELEKIYGKDLVDQALQELEMELDLRLRELQIQKTTEDDVLRIAQELHGDFGSGLVQD